MDKELERVRAEAAGIELDEELAARFPVKSRQKLEIPGDEQRSTAAASSLCQTDSTRRQSFWATAAARPFSALSCHR